MLGLYLNARNFVSTRLSREEKGATAVEYGIMVALIVVGIVALVATLGDQLSGAFTDVTETLTDEGVTETTTTTTS